MYDIIRLFAIPVVSTLCATWLWAHGTDPLTATGVGGAATLVAQLTVRMLHDARADSNAQPRGGAVEARAKPRPTYEDITLDDLNALLERIDRGELPGDRHVEGPPVRTIETFYAGDSVFTVIPNAYGTVERR